MEFAIRRNVRWDVLSALPHYLHHTIKFFMGMADTIIAVDPGWTCDRAEAITGCVLV
jgi:hypothetical protein